VTRISLRSSICPGSGSIPFRDYVDSRGLTSYAPDLGELAQRLAVDVHQILNGAKPGDIPIYRPNKFQLLVNLKAAKAQPRNAPDAPRPRRRGNRMMSACVKGSRTPAA